jgi:hypothetical protein
MRQEAGSAADDDAKIEAECDQLRERLLCQGSWRGDRSGWLLLWTGQEWRSRPIVACGCWTLESRGAPPSTVAVLYRQTARLYPEALVRSVDAVTNTGTAALELPEHGMR